MSKQKWLIAGVTLLASGALLTACTNSNSSETTTSSSTSSLSTGEVTTTLDQIDNTKWLYNAEDNVYYQIGISYAANPTDTEQQTLSIFVPGDYMTATDNDDGTYTAKLNTEKTVGHYTAQTAPIVIPFNTPGYSAMSALTDYSSQAADYTKEGMIYVSAGLRGRDSGAPLGVTDAKAAIRYLRYNQGNIAGDTDTIFAFGTSGGGAQASILGASGDSSLYDAYLEEIGAVTGVSDAISGVMAWVPITNLDTANLAYEWNLGSARTDLDDETQAISDDLAAAYAEYINELGLKDSDGNTLTLDASDEGIYQAGSYYDFIKETIENSLNTFLESTTFPYDASSSSSAIPSGGAPSGEAPSGGAPSGEAPSGEGASGDGQTERSENSLEATDGISRATSSSSALDLSGTYESAEDYIAALNTDSEWVSYDSKTNTATITSVADFVKYLKNPSKDVGAFDDFNEEQGENQLFGVDGSSTHWDSRMAEILKGTSYESAYEEDMSLTDSLGNDLTTRINMYTPLYYLSDYYDGVGTSTVAKYWRIRSGINQGDTALSTEANLALALENYGVETVDFATVWGQGHTNAEVSGDATENFVSWINEILSEQ
ncbi:tannase [Streptococcus chenjunshii]|uniref:Tannase n=1 Tax=Streptococcus chenjunshii TaxID=2173853 RepID=A0A372KMJ7_9STRE|nr:subtype A tannase [Streptococcus chenjunshii]AXQ79045.1 tannase [Streptococcus chenjunshii]RFU51241.1 tannase [Streptococcus chenjunshii]RFU53144.1 tannase [Streptococcus chenjunshii]